MRLLRLLIVALAVAIASVAAAADDQPRLQEEVWALPLPLPTIAYVVRPVGDGPFPLAIMNHGVSLDPAQRVFFPLVEFRDAAMWFARRGYMVVAPSGSYGAAAVEVPEAGLFSGVFFSKVGKCTNPNFRDAGLAVAKLDLWIIEYMSTLKRIVPNNVIVVGQSAGGWASTRVERQSSAGEGDYHLCPHTRRPRRRQAKQQLRARQTGGGDRRIRPHFPRADAVDVYRDRHLFRA